MESSIIFCSGLNNNSLPKKLFKKKGKGPKLSVEYLKID